MFPEIALNYNLSCALLTPGRGLGSGGQGKDLLLGPMLAEVDLKLHSLITDTENLRERREESGPNETAM